MAEYISREAIVKEIKEEIKTCDVKFVEDIQIKKGLKIALKDIKAAKATDVQPVKHGRWITKSDVFYIAWQESGRRWEDMPYFATGLNFACSNCFEKFDVNAEGVEKWNGCPLCLARMDGDAE